MIIYNVTTKVSADVQDEWLRWMQEIHIPEVLATGLFTHHLMARLLDIDDTEGPTFAVQYFAANLQSCHNYLSNHAPLLRQSVTDNWGEAVLSFRTLMEVVH